MHLGKTLAAVAVGILLCGCVPVYTPLIGIVMTDVTGPIMSNGRVGAKEGRACAQSILPLVAQGDASIAAAAKAGGIKKIDTIDHYSKSLLGIVSDFCTIVRGS